MSKVELRPHDPAWGEKAGHETQRLAGVLRGNVVRIEHIGSTAIPGIRAKPVIDLMPVVHSLNLLDSKQTDLETLGYAWWGEFHIPGRRFCTLDDPDRHERLFNVHVFESGSPHVSRHVAFRDYLLAHPDQALEYEAEKMRAAVMHPTDVMAYNDAKSAWIRACEIRALAWKQLRSVD